LGREGARRAAKHHTTNPKVLGTNPKGNPIINRVRGKRCKLGIRGGPEAVRQRRLGRDVAQCVVKHYILNPKLFGKKNKRNPITNEVRGKGTELWIRGGPEPARQRSVRREGARRAARNTNLQPLRFFAHPPKKHYQ